MGMSIFIGILCVAMAAVAVLAFRMENGGKNKKEDLFKDNKR